MAKTPTGKRRKPKFAARWEVFPAPVRSAAEHVDALPAKQQLTAFLREIGPERLIAVFDRPPSTRPATCVPTDIYEVLYWEIE